MKEEASRSPFDAGKFVAGALCSIALIAVSFGAYLALGLMDVASDVQPPGWESATMTPSVHASVRRSARSLRNPLPDSQETLIAGGKLYMNDCIGCHGGPTEPASQFGLTFFPPAPQFWKMGTQYKDTEAFWVAKHGIRWSGMFRQAGTGGYSDADLWKVAAFISRIGSLPAPVLKAIQPTPEPK
jgi:mono/diheme cytochrome c family protein